MKLLSINLWYDKYRNKTNAQLASFRQAGYDTYAATIFAGSGQYRVEVYAVTDKAHDTVISRSFIGWRPAFHYLFDHATEQKYDLIYVRRLMSKLLSAAPFIRNTGRIIPIVYEIPTYPLDTNETLLYKIRDSLEMKLYASLEDSIALTTVILRQDIKLPDNWISFHNGIDISQYSVTPVPPLKDRVDFLIVANMADWHRYDRMIRAMQDYTGKYILHLTVIAPENETVNRLRELVKECGLNEKVEFVGKKDTHEIREIAKECHIGIGQLSWSADCSPQINTLKTKDYCAMGLPFVTSCRDTSFEPDYPYAYVLRKMDDELILSDMIDWYEKIHSNPGYRQEMYEYAKENLQFGELVRNITERLN